MNKINFSDQQNLAINHIYGPALVLAVPGAGKTTVLLERIHKLIKENIDPKSILAMTFSKSQADDMKNRYKARYGASDINFSTIHSFTYGLVRLKAKKENKPIELIEASQKFNKYKIVTNIFTSINFRPITDEELEEFFRISGFLKNTLQNYDNYKKKYPTSIINFQKIYESYERFKKENNLIDFDDMLLYAYKILNNDSDIRQYVQNRFKYIQIDEGQDSSLIQLKIAELVAYPENNLFIVCDDDQSIYGFRGAEAKALLNFQHLYPQAKIYLMEDNFRSNKTILRLAQKLIENNTIRYKKNIIANKNDDENVNILIAKNSKSQAKGIIKRALALRKDGKSVAILYRNNISAINLINHLSDDDDFYIKDSKFAFYNNFIFYDLENIFKLAHNPCDIEAFEKIYYKLNMYFKKEFILEIKKMNSSWPIIKRLEACTNINKFYLEKIDLLSYYLDKIASRSFEKSIKLIFNELGYYDYLKELSKRKSVSIKSFDRIIDTIINISEGLKTYGHFRKKIDTLIYRQKSKSNIYKPLMLSTIHGSKGLEFDIVFLIDLVKDEFPSSFSKNSNDKNILEEERRLFYVGMTRAKSQLNISYLKYLNSKNIDPSEFINEIKINK